MALMSHIHPDDQKLIEEICQITISGQSAAPITKLIDRFKRETARADDNARQIEVLKSEIAGMERMARIFAEAGK